MQFPPRQSELQQQMATEQYLRALLLSNLRSTSLGVVRRVGLHAQHPQMEHHGRK